MVDTPTPSTRASAALLQRDQRVDHFLIVRPLGHGGFGEVYLARDTRLGRRVALKIVHPRHLGSDEAVQRFLFEARATARFSHPHIVTVYAVGEHEGMPYVALEYLEGRTLRQQLLEGPMARAEALRTALAIAEALQEAHAGGILHRDLKPENILLAKDGRLRVLDFGLAKRIDAQSVGATDVSVPTAAPTAAQAAAIAPTEVMSRPLGSGAADLDGGEAGATLGPTLPPATQPQGAAQGGAALPLLIEGDASQTLGEGFDSSALSGVRGTPYYMAPEQWAAAQQTPAVDLWAFGVLLHELLTGTFPFAARQAIAIGHEVCSPTPLTLALDTKELAPELLRLVTSCLDKDALLRPTAAGAVEVLRELLSSGRAELAEEQGPFRGLLPFGERHAGLYFGREAELAAFLELLRDEPVLAVVGPSGAGKSSFVAAGVVPRLREQGRTVLLRLRPGPDPFGALAARLRGGDQTSAQVSRNSASLDELQPASAVDEAEALAAELRATPTRLGLYLRQLADEQQARIVLFVDQLEELFTQSPAAQRLRFMQALASASDDAREPVRTIVTLRDDFLGRVAEGEAARRVLSRIVVLRSPDRAALEAILTRSLATFGYRYEDERIVGEMIEAIGEEPAALPLLSFAGRMLWERRQRDERLLPRAAYEQMGGVAGALATHADAVVQGLSSEQQSVARALLLRLITAEGTRRAMSREALLEGLGAEASLVLVRLTEARLLTVRQGTDGAQHELAHETLISSWKRLARWLDESRDERVFLAEIEQAAQLWLRRGRRDDEVWSGDALEDARRGLARCEVVPELVSEFVAAAERRARERELAARRRRGVVRGGIVGGVIALVLVTLAWGIALRSQARKAAVARDGAIKQLARAHSEGAALALRQGEPQRARAMLRSALEAGLWRGPLPDEVAQQVRFAAWRLEREPLLWTRNVPGHANDLAFSADSKALVAIAAQVHRFDVATGRERALPKDTQGVVAVTFSPDGRWMALARKGEVVAYPEGGGATQTFRAPAKKAVHGLRYGPSFLYARYEGGILRWQRAKPLEAPRFMACPIVRDLHVVGDDVHILGGAVNELWRYRGFGGARELIVRDERRKFFSFAVDGGKTQAFGLGLPARLLFLRTGGQLVRNWLSEEFWALALDSRHQLLAVGLRGGVQLWDVERNQQLVTTPLTNAQHGAKADKVRRLTFSPDGKLLAALTGRGTLAVWRVSALYGRRSFGHQEQVTGLAARPDGRWVASVGADRSLRFWDAKTGRQRLVVALEHSARALAYRPDGAVLAVGARSIWLRDGESGKVLKRLEGYGDSIIDLAYDPAGRRLAALAWGDRRLRIWQPEQATYRDIALPSQPAQVAWRPDGKKLAVGLRHARKALVVEVDVATGQQRLLLPQRKRTASVRSVGYDAAGKLLVRFDDGTLLIDGEVTRGGAPMESGLLRATGDRQGKVTYHVTHGNVLTGSTIDLRRRSDGRLLRRLPGSRVAIVHVVSDAAGLVYATGGRDGAVRIWQPNDRMPRGWTPLLASQPARLLTAQGVRFLGAGPRQPLRPGARSWERATLRSEAARLASDGTLCLLDPAQQLELWDTNQDRRLRSWQLDRLLRVRTAGPRWDGAMRYSSEFLAAVPRACLVLGGDGLSLHRAVGPPQKLCTGCRLTGAVRPLVIQAGKISRPNGRGLQPVATVPGTDLVLDLGGLLAVGGNRQLQLYDSSLTKVVRTLSNNGAALTATERGPARTVLLGEIVGRTQLLRYDLGRLVESFYLHGAVTQIVRAPGRAYVASELGDARVLDTAALELDECALLRRVWSYTPLVWRAGKLQVAPIPVNHRCAMAARTPRSSP